MATMSPRAGKLASLVQRIVAQNIMTDLHDMRLRGITITDVHVTNDLQLARVYWTVYASEGKEDGIRKRAEQALSQAKGRIRSRIGQMAGLRLTPQIEFIYDSVPEAATNVEDLLDVALKKDENIKKLSDKREYAGDVDPYKHSFDVSYGDTAQE